MPQLLQKGVELSGFTVSFGEDLLCGDSILLPVLVPFIPTAIQSQRDGML